MPLPTLRLLIVALTSVALVSQPQQVTPLPNRADSVKFAAIGDYGNGERAQYEVGQQMAAARAKFPFDLVITLGDNFYGGQGPADLVKKFERPYAALLSGGVRFQASLGNHDDDHLINYPPLNMNGQRYYSYTRRNVRFLALDSNLMNAAQLKWIETTLGQAREDWKICYFHHPLYSNANRHGSSMDLRVLMEPIFIKHNVNVVFQGHDHTYERLRPQNGVYYFVSGAAGELRRGDMRPTDQTAASFDQDQSFMLVEIADDTMYFQSISRTGRVVDSGSIARQGKKGAAQLVAVRGAL
jgi:3',5'-cyclic AMP phosphodiesterase CpdA